MKEFIKNILKEALSIPSLRLPKNISVSPEEIEKIKKVNWSDISIEDFGGSGSIAHLGINLPFESKLVDGIVVDIQIIKDEIYQIHIHMAKELRGLGLGYKIYKALIKDLGHLYSGKGRRLNPMVDVIWGKLKQDPDFECISNEKGDLCMIKNNPIKDTLVNFINR
jgi:hypothetical protein